MTNPWRGALLAMASALACGPAFAATPAPARTEITTEGAREDLELAISAVEAALPDLYWRQSRRQWATAKAAARTRVAGVTNSESLWRILRPLVGQIGEGHLGVQLSEAMSQHYRDAPRFPLDLLWTEQGAFVLAGYGEAADVPRGARLISVDGVGAADLLSEMVAVTPHDGAIRTGTMRDISGRGFASILYRLRGPQSRFQVVLEGAEGRTERDLAAVSRLARPAEVDDPSPLPMLEWLDDHTAYLNVPTFSNARLRAVGATFPEAIQAVFAQLDQRGAKNLILDLRENGGGSEPNESILFSYLVETPLRKYAAVEARGRHLAVTSLNGQRFETDVFDAGDRDQQRPIPGGRWTRRNTPPHGLMSRWTSFAPIFHGRLVVLAGGDTFSGGAELASMLRHTGRAVFVGEEVGGADDGNTSGYRWTVRLPNSGMKLAIPLLQFRMAWSSRPPGRGVLPDCPAPPEALHFGERRDRAWRIAATLFQQDWSLPRQAVCPEG
ncbi:S41 family peptidase [Caulobacter sp. RL271]|uniref:S41 family peptidase n=1 Tax=Caulobacter segnis TaxID=88688 RepID=A0ABY4ZNC7_9CAUL|nr:S41 family peptidase [Caulobacter segnis]USQ94170.1 S41 family peptidase [Caulobacter segnis]